MAGPETRKAASESKSKRGAPPLPTHPAKKKSKQSSQLKPQRIKKKILFFLLIKPQIQKELKPNMLKPTLVMKTLKVPLP